MVGLEYKPFERLKPLLVGLLLLLLSTVARSQSCNCPPLATCAPCDNDIIGLTLRYNGFLPAIITVTDGGGHVMYGPGLISTNQSFSFTSDSPSSFRSHEVNVTGALDILGTPLIPRKIETDCDDGVEIGRQYGQYTVIAAESHAGPLCCEAEDMEIIPPVITCPANVNVALTSGQCQGVATWSDPIVSDNCNSVTLTSTHAKGSLFNLGTTLVTYTATDDYGNTATCSFNVIVTDNTAPVITGCPTNINVSLLSSECSKVVTWTAPTVQSCVNLTSNFSPGATFPLGTTTVTYTATDAANNTSTCSFNVVVSDVTAPVISGCPGNINVSLTAAECSKVVTWTPPTVNSCATISSPILPGATFPLGTTTVTYTATDAANNTSTCSFNVIVTDNTAPVITNCPTNINVSLLGSECSKVVTWTAPTVASCVSLTPSIPSGSIFPVGTTIVTYTATDAANNTATCSFNVVVTDNTAPVISNCPSNINVSLLANECSKVVTWTAPTVASCVNLIPNFPSGSSFPLGTTTVTYTATDAANNTSTCSFNVFVTDNTAPMITNCPTNINVSLLASECSKAVTWTVPTVTSCVTLTSNFAPGATFPLGTTTVTYTATDAANNTSTCSFNVIVTDNTAPVITGCPANINVSLLSSECSKVVTWTAPTVQSCVNLTSNFSPGATFPLGTTTVTYTAADAANNTSTCSFNVVVSDVTPPLISGCPATINVSLTAAECSKVVTWTPPTVNSCATISSPILPGATFPLGTTTVTYTATDAANNTSTCSFNVIVTDNTAPVITNCPTNINVSLLASECSKVVTWTAPTVASCVSLTPSIPSGSSFPVGTTIVTYTATDAANNTSTCSFNVVVTDNTAPVISNCPSNINVSLLASECSKVVTWTAPTVASCVNLTTNFPSGSSFPLGTTTVTYTATDAANNTSTCSFNVVVTDITPPVISGCPSNINASLLASECSKAVTWTVPTVTSCVTLTSNFAPGATFPLGTTTVTYTAKDAANNTSTCSFNVVVMDITPPVISGCPANINVSLTASECTKVVTWTPPTVNSCATISGSKLPGAVFPLGTTTVTYTATDAANNTSTCSFNVIVTDNTPPVITSCPSDITVSLTASECSKVVTWTPPVVESCVTLTSSIASGSSFPTGSTTVTYTAKDAANNTSTCSFKVIVTDNTPPVISSCPGNINASLTAAECSKIVTWTPPTVASCVTLTSDFPSGHAFPAGTTLVTYTAKDAANNTSTCTFNVVVTDATAPVITGCPSDISVSLTASECSKAVTWTLPTVPSCVTLTSDIPSGSIFAPGITVVTYTAKDAANNTSTCSFRVIVTDNTPPVISNCPPNINVSLNAAECEKVVTWTAPTVNSCTTIASSIASGTTFPLGTTTVIYTATDAANNTATCSFNVVVNDNTAPIISGCPTDINATLAASECEKIVTWVPPTVNGCAIISSSAAPGSTFQTGTTTVTYTAKDAANNVSVCSFKVTVTDNIAPEFIGCPSEVEAELTETENAKVVTWIPPTAASCVTISSNYTPGTAFVPGIHPVIYTAIDAAGNEATCEFNVIVKDKIPPKFTNYAARVEAVTIEEDACDAAVTWTEPTITDNCGVQSHSSSRQPGTRFEVGVTRVTYEALDINGNTSSCEFEVVVKNRNPPVIIGCPEDTSVRVGESGETPVTWTEPSATVLCGTVTITGSHEPGSIFSVGTTKVQYIATDESGTQSICSFNVVVDYEEFTVDIGKVVTPDDNSINDFWELGNIDKFSDNSVLIVDRWGGLIYSASGYNNGNVAWRGTNTKGELVPTGTYFYTISVRFRHLKIEKKGFIELIR